MSHPARTTSRPTAAILYPGEMGAAVGALLVKRGVRVISTLGERSAATAARCGQAGIEVLPRLEEVVAAAQFVFSLVPPASAAEMATEYCGLAHLAPADAVFVDVNSIGPELASSIAQQVHATGRGFVDAAINGLAKNLTTSCTLYLSGQRAGEVEALFNGSMRTRPLGPEIGRASAMKMLLSGVSKGVCALYIELALAAHRRGMLSEMNEALAMIYPGIASLAQRMVPTYAQHAQRRATEMGELEQTAAASEVEPCVIAAVRQLHEELAEVDFSADAGVVWTVDSLIGRLAALKAQESALNV